MRILLVANTLPPDDISGVGEQVLQLAAGLEGLGHEVGFWDAVAMESAPASCSFP